MGYRNITLTMTMIWLFKAIKNKEETKNIVFFISTCLGSFLNFYFYWKPSMEGFSIRQDA